ncbi:MAG: SpoIID/LytB domain-containing protein [Clostridiales bacterium]|nr:SpoIID/LytB domain-containing protein [Clostridiales bacterium]
MTIKYIGFGGLPTLTRGLKAIVAACAILIAGCGDSANNPSPPPATQIDEPIVSELSEPLGTELPPAQTSAPAVINVPKTGRIGSDLSVSRAMAAKMIALALYSEEFITSMEREIIYTDTNDSLWYDKYVNAIYIQGVMRTSSDLFHPNEPLTLEQAQALVKKLDQNQTIKFKVSEDNLKKAISYELWIDIYVKLLNALDSRDIDSKSFVLMAASGNNAQLSNWYMITDIGPYRHAGLNVNLYIDNRLDTLVKGKEVLALLAVTDSKPTVPNAYIVSTTKNSITIFSGGVERTYEYINNLKDVAGAICDIRINKIRALEVNVKTQNMNGVVIRTNNSVIEIDEQSFSRDPDFKVYSIVDGAVKWKEMKDIIVGTDMAIFYLDTEKACAAVITKTVSPQNIRVALNTTKFASLIHENVFGTCDTEYLISAYGFEEVAETGEVFNIKDLPSGRVTIEPLEEKGKIQLMSITRDWPGGEYPKYSGKIEIGEEQGGYSIVNELPLELYLYSVVPSEMPTVFGVEAAKAQAISARSYAYNQFFENRFHRYGAHVDDSVTSQVYNNIPATEISKQAVDETKGQVISFDGSVIVANFFSTSSGMTANSGEVWAGAAKQFPTDNKPYLVASREYTGKDYGDLTDESNASKFFKSLDVTSYDSEYPWFRWNVSMSVTELSASINANLKKRYEAAPSLIKTLQTDGNYRSRPIDTIGQLMDMEVTSRGQGGNIIEMKFIGKQAEILVGTEYNIRALLQPRSQNDGGDITITRKDGSTVSNIDLLPSAFFCFDKISDADDNLKSLTIYGGGYGHGVGMSQNGVKGMIDKGFNYQQIIAHYYPGTDVTKIKG